MQQSVYLRYKSKHKLKESLMDRLNIIQRAQYSDTHKHCQAAKNIMYKGSQSVLTKYLK